MCISARQSLLRSQEGFQTARLWKGLGCTGLSPATITTIHATNILTVDIHGTG